MFVNFTDFRQAEVRSNCRTHTARPFRVFCIDSSSDAREKITLMLPSQKIKLLMENRETFLNQNKLAHLPLPHTRSRPENFTTKFMAQRGAMVERPSLV